MTQGAGRAAVLVAASGGIVLARDRAGFARLAPFRRGAHVSSDRLVASRTCRAERVAELEVQWPMSGMVQRFVEVPVNQSIVIVEGEEGYRTLDWKPIPLPPEAVTN